MDEPLAGSSAQGVSSISCVCHSAYGTPGCEHSCVCCKDEGFEPEIACGQDDHVVEEVRTVLAKVMHLYDGGGAYMEKDSDEEEEEDDDAPLLLESDSTLVAADTDMAISPAFPFGGSSESSIDESDDGNPSANGTPLLVSAMKGTRAKQGIITKLSVSWAPDVYDPPITSDSHCVRGRHRSSRKSHYKYKPAKSSSSSSSSNRSANSSKRDKKHSRHSSSSNRKYKTYSYRSSTSLINRTESSVPQYLKACSSSRTDSHDTESARAYPLALTEIAAVPEAVPVLKTVEQIKCATSCKEKPFNLLSRQFSPAKYKGMFSFWSQNQLAS